MKKQTTIKKQFRVPLYFHKVVVIKTETLGGIMNKHGLTSPRKEFGAFCFLGEDNVIYMVFNKADISNDLIAHECLHCMDYIFLDIGYKPEQGNQEPANHLLAFLVDKCHTILKV